MNSTALRLYDHTFLKNFFGSTALQSHISMYTLWLYGSTALWLYGSTPSSTTLQLYSSTALKLHTKHRTEIVYFSFFFITVLST